MAIGLNNNAFPSAGVTGALAAAGTVASLAGSIKGILLAQPQATIGYQPIPSTFNTQIVPLNAPAFMFNYEGENTSTLISDITDNFVEDNTTIQDQIALRPVIITVQGFIGELNDLPPSIPGQAGQIISTAIPALKSLAQYAPGLSASALNAYNEAFFAAQIAQNAVNLVANGINTITGSTGESVISGGAGISRANLAVNQNKQQVAYQTFYSYWSSRTLFTIQTPWAVFTNMAIQSLKAVQDASTPVITDFEITWKQMRFVSQFLGTSTPNADNFSAPLNMQAASVTQLGTSNLTSSLTTIGNAISSVL